MIDDSPESKVRPEPVWGIPAGNASQEPPDPGKFSDALGMAGPDSGQELKRDCVRASPSLTSDSTASAAAITWRGTTLRSALE
jgi:hypothetical protein